MPAGLWTKDMRAKSNLPQPHITKILRVLENRGLVKSVKNVNNPSRKVRSLSDAAGRGVHAWPHQQPAPHST